MATIDELQIEIKANASDATRAIDGLINNLSRLNSALDLKFGSNLTSSLTDLSNGLTSINNATKSIDAVKIKEVSGALRSLSTQSKNLAALSASASQADNIGNVFSNIAMGLGELSNTKLPDFSSITGLATSMSKLSGKNVQTLPSVLPSIASAIQQMNGVQIPNLEGVDILAKGLRSLGSKSVREAAASLPWIVNSLRDIQHINLGDSVGQVAEFAAAMRSFGYKSAQAAADNIPRITQSFLNMASALATAPQISRNTIDLANAMANLAANGGRVSTGMNRAHKGLKLFGNGVQRAQKQTHSLASTIGRITATYWLLFRALGKVKDAIDLSSDLTETQNVVSQTFKDESDKMNEFAKTSIQNFGMAELQAKKVGSRFQAMGKGMEIPNAAIQKSSKFLQKASAQYGHTANSMADMSIELTKLTADMGSFYNMDYDEVAQKMEAIFTGQTRPLRTFGIDLTEANLKQWALNNGLDANIKKMTQAQKAMLRYQYVMAHTNAAQGDFIRTQDTWANQTRMLKQNFQQLGIVIGKTFINAFKPAVKAMNAFLLKVTSFAEQVFNALGQIFGWKVEIDATGIADDYEDAADAAGSLADNTGDAADNAKELNKQLAGFDKLNNLTTSKDKSGSGSGSGAGAGGGGAGSGKEGSVKSSLTAIESNIKDLETLGKTIASTIANALGNINWEEDVYPKAEKFGKGLADFMNGLFAGEEGARLFKSMGSTIAGAVNTVMIAADTWANTLEWAKIGANIKNGIVTFLTDWKPEIAGSAVGGIVSGIAQALYSAVSNRDAWKLLGEKISTGINAFLSKMSQIDKVTGKTGWEALFLGGFNAISGLGEALGKALGDKKNWEMLIDGIGKGIKAVIEEIANDPSKLKSFLTAALFLTFGKAIATYIVSNLKIGTITLALTKLTISGIKKIALASGIPTLIANLVSSGIGALKINISKLKINLMDKVAAKLSGVTFTKMIASALGVSEDAVTLAGGSVLSVALGVTLGITITKIAIKNDWFNKLEKLIKNAKKKLANLKLPWGESAVTMDGRKVTLHFSLSAKIDSIKWEIKTGKLWQKFLDEFFNFDVTKELASQAKKKFEDAGNADNPMEIGSSIFEGIMDGFAAAFMGISEPFVDFFDWVIKGLKKVFGIASPAKEMKPIGKDIVKGILAGFEDVNFVDEFGKWLNSIWSKLEGKVTDLALSASVSFDTKKQDVKDWFSKVKSWWNDSKEKLKVSIEKTTTAQTVKTWWNVVRKWWNNTKENLKIGVSILTSTLSSMWNTITSYFRGKTVNINIKGHSSSGGSSFAQGGVYKNHKWHTISQFASGGLPTHGSMFVAGEHGAEVVGHVNGQTEVLNQSQLASVMYSAVANAMSAYVSEIHKSNEYLNVIARKDVTISSRDVFNATRSEATSYYNRTGRPAFEG